MSTKKPAKADKKADKNRPFQAALAGMKKALEAAPAAPAKPAPAPRAKPAKVDAVEEAATFDRMMSGVVPLADGKATRLPKSAGAAPKRAELDLDAARARAKAEADAVHDHLRRLVDGAARFEVSDDGERVEGRRLDLPPQAMRGLRRGAVTVDARLDLHRQSLDEAREALWAFLRDRRARGDACVLVIHGKGEHSPAGVGVLRGEIAAWLSQGRASEHVAAFATAHPDDGGSGAVYVLLRRELR